MAPRKINSKIPIDAPPVRKTRGRTPKIQSPPTVEMQIPVQRSVYFTRKRTKKSNLSVEKQIELANEVIQTQLGKKVNNVPNVTEKPIEIIINNIPVQNDNEVDDKAPVKKLVRKRANTNTETIPKPTISRKRAADSTQQPAKRRKVCEKNTVSQNTVPQNTAPQNTAPQKPEKETKPSASAKGNITRKKRTIQGKKKNDVDVVQKCLPALDEPVEIKEVFKPIAAVIDSRKTSATSVSNFSWTKDISSSSTTTCVTVATNDFVRIDNKIPVIQLTSVDSELPKYQRCESEESSSESDSSSSSDSVTNVSMDVPTVSLNLSTSSPSICQGNPDCNPKSDSLLMEMTKALVKLSFYLNKLDEKIAKWIGYGKNLNDNKKKLNDLILTVLDQERDMVGSCRNIIQIFSRAQPDNVETDEETNSVVAYNLNASYDDDNPITKDNVLLNENVEYPRSPRSPSTTYDSDYAIDNFNYVPFQQNNDDDDALSLFAESITGIEPSRTNNSCESPDAADVQDEEYVPLPLNKDTSSEKYDYCPTKVTRPDAAVKRNVCEKQNADSTSIYKEGNVNNIMAHNDVGECVSDPSASGNDQREEELEEGQLAEPDNRKEFPNQIGPPQITSIFQPVSWKRTAIFRGLCFFNLTNACKKQPYCPFLHVVPSPSQVKARLASLSEGMFIKEYIYLSSHPMLRRSFGFYFVAECHRRGLLRILVEMAIDFVVNVTVKTKEDLEYQLSTLEYILLGLNDVGLSVCEDLLNYPVDGDTRLCHVLMRIIANSQNFSRFKQVFLNLNNLMVRHNRTFDSDVAAQILERVCILPDEERLLRAVFDMIKHTDTCIFANSLMCKFETRLRTVNYAMYEELMAYKNDNFNTSAVSSPFSVTPAKGENLEPLKINCINDVEKERYTSPDTTKADTLQNKPSLDTSITRAVNLTRTCYNNQFSSTPTKHNGENWLNNDFRNWRQSSPRAPVPLMALPHTRPMRPRNGRRVKMHRMGPINFRPRPPRNF
ncbi:uncharacterized protein LOC115452480 isoform X3 [Manduca sexta]|nr:uncharacterized protein LOC115452480 isoform X3 [Manduca sexta]